MVGQNGARKEKVVILLMTMIYKCRKSAKIIKRLGSFEDLLIYLHFVCVKTGHVIFQSSDLHLGKQSTQYQYLISILQLTRHTLFYLQ